MIKGSRSEQKEEVNCDVVATKSSVAGFARQEFPQDGA